MAGNNLSDYYTARAKIFGSGGAVDGVKAGERNPRQRRRHRNSNKRGGGIGNGAATAGNKKKVVNMLIEGAASRDGSTEKDLAIHGGIAPTARESEWLAEGGVDVPSSVEEMESVAILSLDEVSYARDLESINKVSSEDPYLTKPAREINDLSGSASGRARGKGRGRKSRGGGGAGNDAGGNVNGSAGGHAERNGELNNAKYIARKEVCRVQRMPPTVIATRESFIVTAGVADLRLAQVQRGFNSLSLGNTAASVHKPEAITWRVSASGITSVNNGPTFCEASVNGVNPMAKAFIPRGVS